MTGILIDHHLPAVRVTPDDGFQYFFGYFDKSPWDPAGKRLLAHRTNFCNRQPRFGDVAEVGTLIDGVFKPYGETRAWCWQQGAMLQWFDNDNIIYNDFEDEHYVARILNLQTGAVRTLHRPIYCLSPDRKYAISLDFARLDRERPGYGYPGLWTPILEMGWPDDDGLWLIDIAKDTSTLSVSLGRICRDFPGLGTDQATSWFNHILISPDSKRFAFFHRWRHFGPWGPGVRSHITHMFTCNLDGSGLYPLNLEDMSSHYVWTDNNHIINFCRRFADGDRYHLFTDQTGEVKTIAPEWFATTGDGHCTYSLDGKWMLTDSYPSARDNCRGLFLYDIQNDKGYEVGRFFADPNYIIPARCDLHPRLSADNRFICFDSIHEGARAVYLMDVSELTKP